MRSLVTIIGNSNQIMTNYAVLTKALNVLPVTYCIEVIMSVDIQ